MSRCFVIQPFDKGAFDKRYRDVLVPAIKAAGLQPYRVDQDPTATILIEHIESGIQESEICLADITTDNPNIWYEVGFALAFAKPVVFICADPRPNPFPFDIRHRQITTYSPESRSDFEKLEKEITTHLLAQVRKSEAMQTIASLSPVNVTEGLSSYEIAALVIVMENRLTGGGNASPYEIDRDMQKAGYTRIAASLSVESLLLKGMLSAGEEFDSDSGEKYEGYRVTSTGVQWLLDHQDSMKLTKQTEVLTTVTDEDIPF